MGGPAFSISSSSSSVVLRGVKSGSSFSFDVFFLPMVMLYFVDSRSERGGGGR